MNGTYGIHSIHSGIKSRYPNNQIIDYNSVFKVSLSLIGTSNISIASSADLLSLEMSDTNQICFMEVDGKIVFFNEAEAVSNLDAAEPEELELNARRGKKVSGKRAMDMEGLTVERIDHYMTDEELTAEFGEKGWKQLPDTVVKRDHFTPAKITVDEHHIGVYADKAD